VADDYAIVSELYDSVVPYRDRPDVSLFVDLAKEAGGPVLELGCGTGRILIPTARAGVPITGLDLSPQMLAVCRRKLACEPADVQARATLVEADMRHFDLGTTFRLVTIPFRPFQLLLEVRDQLACLAGIKRHLGDGGRVVIDVFNPSLPALTGEVPGAEESAGPDFVTPDGRRVVHTHRIASRDVHRQILHVELIYTITRPDGGHERAVHELQMRYFFRYEIEHLLVRAGFVIEAVYADYEKNPYGSKYPGELIFVASRASGP
jgi:SAM-dependent methyltransferase